MKQICQKHPRPTTRGLVFDPFYHPNPKAILVPLHAQYANWQPTKQAPVPCGSPALDMQYRRHMLYVSSHGVAKTVGRLAMAVKATVVIIRSGALWTTFLAAIW